MEDEIAISTPRCAGRNLRKVLHAHISSTFYESEHKNSKFLHINFQALIGINLVSRVTIHVEDHESRATCRPLAPPLSTAARTCATEVHLAACQVKCGFLSVALQRSIPPSDAPMYGSSFKLCQSRPACFLLHAFPTKREGNIHLKAPLDLMSPTRWVQHVIATVPKDKLLVHNSKQGWEPLCKFLNLEVRLCLLAPLACCMWAAK